MLQTIEPLMGTRGDRQFFRFEERDELEPRQVLDVLRGRQLGVIFRDVIPAEVQTALAAKFWASPARTTRTPGDSHYVGAFHWNKAVETYLQESRAIDEHVREIIGVPGSPWTVFRDGLAAELSRHGASLRLAELDGMNACPAMVRAWTKDGDFSLDPHEDAAQCKDPRQSRFEIQRALDYELCSVNMCVEHGHGGQLVLWNIRPGDESRRRHGLEYTGFGYPAEALAGLEELRIDIRRGDVYVFNSAYVHAVGANTGNRTTVSFLMGFKDDRTVVTWT